MHVSPADLTRFRASTGANVLVQIRNLLGTSSFSTAGSDLLAEIRVLGVVPASGVSVPAVMSVSSIRRVEVAHPQVQVALLPLLQSSKVLLHLKVSVSMVRHLTVPSKLQILQCAIPVHELWPPETPVFSQSTPSCDDTHDETICTPYIQVSMSTFHREQFARPKSVLSPQDFAENQ